MFLFSSASPSLFLLRCNIPTSWHATDCLQDHLKGKRAAKTVSLSSALLKKSGPPPTLPSRPGAAAGAPSGGGVGVGSLGLGPTSISGGFGSNGSSGTGGFGSNGSRGSPRAGGGGGWGGAAAGPGNTPLSPRSGAGAGGKGKGKAAPDLAHCFELHSGKLLGDKRNREGRLYFKVPMGLCVRV